METLLCNIACIVMCTLIAFLSPDWIGLLAIIFICAARFFGSLEANLYADRRIEKIRACDRYRD